LRNLPQPDTVVAGPCEGSPRRCEDPPASGLSISATRPCPAPHLFSDHSNYTSVDSYSPSEYTCVDMALATMPTSREATGMDLQLKDKRALVTGSTSGIGAEIARMLAHEGVRVIVHGRDRARAQAVVTEIEAKGDRADVALGDLMAADGIETVIETTNRALGGLDILVNNAGGSNSRNAAGWVEPPLDEWIESYRQNALPAVRLAQAFVPAMRDS